MPCNGVAVQTAWLDINLVAELAREQDMLPAYLREKKIKQVGQIQIFNEREAELRVQGARLEFYGNRIDVVFRGRGRANGRKALEACQQYAGELIQARVLDALKARGVHISGFIQDAQTGAITIQAEL
jgi:hypothetical protein